MTILNPILDDLGGRFRFRAEVRRDRSNANASAVRLVLLRMGCIDGEGVPLHFNTPVVCDCQSPEGAGCRYGVESVSIRDPSDESRDEFPSGHVEVVTRRPDALLALLRKAWGADFGPVDDERLARIFRNAHGPEGPPA